MKTNKRYITHAFFILFVMGVIAIVMNVFIPKEHGMAYYEQMLLETGLDFEQMPYSVEHQYCDESCIDAQVYYELKVKGSDSSKVINRYIIFQTSFLFIQLVLNDYKFIRNNQTKFYYLALS